MCLQSEVVYHLNSTGWTTLNFIPTISDILNSTDGQYCLHQTLTGVVPRDEMCNIVEYSVMASVYGAPLGMYLAECHLFNGK